MSGMRSLKGASDSQPQFIGFSLLTVGVGALQIALDKGQEDDWFGSEFITTLVLLAAASLISLVIWERLLKEPIVDVRLFKNFNVATTNLVFLVLGAALFSSTVLMPQTSADSYGLSGTKGRDGAFRWRPRGASFASHRR